MARAKQYWNEKHENLAMRWCSATTESEITEVYYALKPNIHYMTVQIMQRYFQVPQARQNDLINDCITEAFLRLKKYYNPQKQKSYSYTSMVIKNYLHEQMVRIPNTMRVAQIDLLDDEEDTLDRFSRGIEYSEPRNIDFKAISDYFIAGKDKAQQKLNNLVKRHKNKKLLGYELYNYNRVCEKHKRHIMVCQLCLDFIDKYESADVNRIAEYCFLNSDMGRKTVVSYFARMFKVNVTIPNDDVDFADARKGLNMYNDDYTPIEDKNYKRSIRRKKSELPKI